jgi:nicotinate-nucleotide adenylyltransferase
VLGGAFDPVHCGHTQLIEFFSQQFFPTEIRIIPTGLPYHKPQGLCVSPTHRINMLHLAFNEAHIPITLDTQEIERAKAGHASYTVETLQQLRNTIGPDTPIIFLMGADQLQKLNSWYQWHDLFNYAHFVVAARAGLTFNLSDLPTEIGKNFIPRLGTIEQLRTTPFGYTYFEPQFTLPISATEIRLAFQQGIQVSRLIPQVVLDYIQQHQLYTN